MELNDRQRRTLEAIRARPTRANIRWTSVVSLLDALGDVGQGSGSRVRVEINGVRAVFHAPHPANECDKGMIDDVRDYLTKAGV